MRNMRPLSPGERILHRYEIVTSLGSGPLASTYLAQDLARRSSVTFKLLNHTGNIERDAFRDEFAVLTCLLHPFLVRVRDFGVVHIDSVACLYYVSDYVVGVTLNLFAAHKPWPQLIPPLRDATSALALLHRHDLIHGDVKPTNVLVTPQGRGVLIDPGCAASAPLPSRLTAGSLLAVTPEFLAPELVTTGLPSVRSDLFALGLTFRQTIAQASDIPSTFLRLVDRLTHPDPACRPVDAVEVAELIGVPTIPLASPSGEAVRLIGRDTELATFDDSLRCLTEGRPGSRAICLQGIQGAGKTRLLQEMKWKAQLQCQVIEAFPSQPNALGPLVRAAGGDDSRTPGIEDLLDARDRTARKSEPTVFIVDDAHLLSESQRAALDAVVQSTERTDSLLVLLACSRESEYVPPVAVFIDVGPLPEDALQSWLGSLISDQALKSVMRLTGGLVSQVELLCSDLLAGRIHEHELADCPPQQAIPSAQLNISARVGRLSIEQQRALGWVALFDGRMPDHGLERFGVDSNALRDLECLRWIELSGTHWRLRRMSDCPAVLAALGSHLVMAVRRPLAAQIEQALSLETDNDERSYWVARLAQHLACVGETTQAENLLEGHRDLMSRHPNAWRLAAEALSQAAPSPSTSLLLASTQVVAGKASLALSTLATVLRDRSDNCELLSSIHLEAGQAYLKLGKPKQARRQFERAGSAAAGSKRQGIVASFLARTLLQLGDWAAAQSQALRFLRDEHDAAAAACLQEVAGMAASYLGERDTATRALSTAVAMQEARGDPADLARALSCLAIHQYALGNLSAATHGYQRALELAERHNLADLVATGALNLGTVYHQRGDWGQALQSYDRALRLATAIRKARTAATVRWNQAKLFADIGMSDRAEAALEPILSAAQQLGAADLEGVVGCLRAEIAVTRGQIVFARSLYAAARRRFESENTAREIAEIDLQLLELAVGDLDMTTVRMQQRTVSEAIGEIRALDLQARLCMVQGRIDLADGKQERAITVLERALESAIEVGQRHLEAEILVLLADACERQNAMTLAQEYASRARARWERIGACLPTGLQDSFWRHPKRQALARLRQQSLLPPQAGGQQSDSLAARLRKLLEINRSISESLQIDEVLRATVDAAIEFTGAERGFLILVPKQGDRRRDLCVATARSLDREQVSKSQLKFSRSIAQQVIASGQPMLTIDAQQDDRFRKQSSVHALRLRSVLSVPVRTKNETLGALYLDNRFQEGRFKREDLDLVVAFADQAAIALRNARMHAELVQRSSELEAERERVQDLMRNQRSEIERLTQEVRVRQDALETRYDYGQIVARSTAMRAVLSVLDRVTDSTISVLIQGESGTGKELVARAIHFNGPRRSGPFVSVNCAALTDTLLESELFGHVRGAFTGASQNRTGLVVAARGGTLFLDEVGEMSASMQAKLLRVLQERELRPVGSSSTVTVDIRLVCATNRILSQEVAAGHFREDLYYRVGVVELNIPALRERAEDIPDLVGHLLDRVAKTHGRPPPTIHPKAMAMLLAYPWPGNVRQLENVLARASVLAPSQEIRPPDLELPKVGMVSHPARNRAVFEEAEAARILAALQSCGWNVCEVARRLAVPRNTLYRRLRKYGLTRKPSESP